MSKFTLVYRPLLALALPLIFIQICQASLGLIDTMVAGQYGYKDLAGVGLGSNMWTPVFIFITGILYVLVPKISEQVAAANTKQIYPLFAKGKKLAAQLSVVAFVLVQLLAFSCHWFIAEPEVAVITSNYLHWVAFAMPALVYSLVYRFICEGYSKLMPIIKVVVALVVCNLVLNFLFVFGVGDISGLGGAGCGLATAVSACVVLFIIKTEVKKAVPEICQQPQMAASWADSKELFLEGLPIGIAFVIEVLALTTLAFFASSLGVKQVAAHQIAINLAMVVFMLPLALSSATTIRIAAFTEPQHRQNRTNTAKAALLMATLYGLAMVWALMSYGQSLLLAFSQDEHVLVLAAGLLIYVALFQFFDAIQIVAAGILRGLQQFVSPLLVLLIVYWFVVIPASYFVVGEGWWRLSGDVDSIWLLLSGGLAMAAVVLCLISVKHLGGAGHVAKAELEAQIS